MINHSGKTYKMLMGGGGGKTLSWKIPLRGILNVTKNILD